MTIVKFFMDSAIKESDFARSNVKSITAITSPSVSFVWHDRQSGVATIGFNTLTMCFPSFIVFISKGSFVSKTFIISLSVVKGVLWLNISIVPLLFATCNLSKLLIFFLLSFSAFFIRFVSPVFMASLNVINIESANILSESALFCFAMFFICEITT